MAGIALGTGDSELTTKHDLHSQQSHLIPGKTDMYTSLSSILFPVLPHWSTQNDYFLQDLLLWNNFLQF